MPETPPLLRPLTIMLSEEDHQRLRQLVVLAGVLSGQETTADAIVAVLLRDREAEWLAFMKQYGGGDGPA